jgi:hypothetical protein
MSFRCCVSRVHVLVFCKTLFGMCVNLIPGHTYYEYSVLAQKSGMTHDWDQSNHNRRTILSFLFPRKLHSIMFLMIL